MRLRRIAATAAVCASLLMVGPTRAVADAYDSAVQRAEQMWRDGQKIEAVQLYGSVWQQKPDDMERQILYGERSAEVGLSRWAVNFLRVAESNAKGDPERLRKVNLSYAKVYKTLGYPDTARVYEEKAGVREPSRREPVAAPVATPSRYYFGYYTEAPPAVGIAAAPRPTPAPTTPDPTHGHLRKRLVVAAVGTTVGRSDLDRYVVQVRAMLVDELRQTGRFALVEDAALTEALLVQTEISEFTNLSPGSRHVDIGPLAIDRGRSRVRLGMTVRLYDGSDRNLVASENVSVEKVADSAGGGFSISFSRPRDWDWQNSILGSATRDLARKAVATIVARAEGVPWRARVIRGSGREVEFNMGSQEGVREGDRFRILAPGEKGRGSGRGKGRGATERDVGEIEVIRVDLTTAVGRVLRKEGPFDAGAMVVPSR